MSILVWIREDGIVLQEDSHTAKVGLVIPETKEAAWEWIYMLMRFAEGDMDEQNVPGEFVTFSDEPQ